MTIERREWEEKVQGRELAVRPPVPSYRPVSTILEESVTSLEDKLSCDFRYLNINIGCRLMRK